MKSKVAIGILPIVIALAAYVFFIYNLPLFLYLHGSYVYLLLLSLSFSPFPFTKTKVNSGIKCVSGKLKLCFSIMALTVKLKKGKNSTNEDSANALWLNRVSFI